MTSFLSPLLANLVMSFLLWLFATWRRNVSLVDLLWPLFFVVDAWIWFRPANASFLHWSVLLLVMAWGGRLHTYLARRNLGHGEDRRYQEIRRNNRRGFWWRSFFIVFALQAFLAWMVSWSIYGALQKPQLSWLSTTGLIVALAGLVYESIADWQLSRFRADRTSHGKVMDRGLWALSRHPNYFGECCFWWGIFLVGLPGAWWCLFSPVLMTVLLLKISGVSLLEKDIQVRRPAYRDYMENTPAFFPDFARCFGGTKP